MSNPQKRPKTQKTRSPRLIAVGLLAIVAISVAATWVASGRIRSPAEAAARTLAPEPSPIMVPIERRVISNEIVTRGTGRFGSPQTLSVVPTRLRSTAAFVDDTPIIGHEIEDGEPAMVMSGRPVVILQGQTPAYRDMGPGMSGDDIRQLEEALDRLGFYPGPVDGHFDDATELAVVAWYADLGYAPVTGSASQREALRSLEADLGAVQRDVVAGQEAVVAARADLIAAQSAWQQAEAAEANASEALIAARSETSASLAVAQAEAQAAATAADQAWIQLPPQWDSPEAEQATMFELETLRIAAATAQAKVDEVRAVGNGAVSAAARAAADAPSERSSAAAAVNLAQARLDLAIQAATLAAAPELRLAADLTINAARAGVHVAADELIFVPEVPVRVAEVHAQRGSPGDGPLFSVTDTIVAIDGALALDQVGLVEPGMTVVVNEPDLGVEAEAVVSFVAAGPGTRGVDGFHVYFEAIVTSSMTPITNIAGASVRLTLSVASSTGAVLAVPASALTLAVDGSSQLLVSRERGLTQIVVEPGLAADGYVEITSASDLAEGDLVVVGFERRATASE